MKKRILWLAVLLSAVLMVGVACDPTEIEGGPEDDKTKYTVIFDTNGVLPKPEDQTVAEGEKAIKPAVVPEMDMYVFEDWYDVSNVEFNFDAEITSDTTIYAKYKIAKNKEELVVILQEQVAIAAEKVAEQEEADNHMEAKYDWTSYEVMEDRLGEAELMADTSQVTEEELLEAYFALRLAIDKLVMNGSVVHEIAYIRADGLYNDQVYAIIGEDNRISFTAYLNDGYDIYTGVEFDITYIDVEPFADGDVNVYPTSISFNAKDDVTLGATANVSASLKSNPSINVSTAVKFVDVDALIEMLKDMQGALDIDNVVHDDIEAISVMNDFYYTYLVRYNEDPRMSGLYEKIEEFNAEMWELSERIVYSKVENTNKYIFKLKWGSCGTEFLYQPQGEFPLGTYTTTKWEYANGAYMQGRMVLSATSMRVEYRESFYSDGRMATAWMLNSDVNYSFDGDVNGGAFYYDEE